MRLNPGSGRQFRDRLANAIGKLETPPQKSRRRRGVEQLAKAVSRRMLKDV